MENDKDSLKVLLGLLNFYSQRATVHAVFVVASIIAIYSVLFSYNNYFGYFDLGKSVIILTYIVVMFSSVYSFANFSKYTTLAESVKQTLEINYLKNKEIQDSIQATFSEKKERSILLKSFMNFTENRIWIKHKIVILFILWTLSVVSPLLWLVLK